MTSLHARTADCPERSARILLDRFAGDLARTERHIVDVQLAAALRADDYDGYLYWRRINGICASLAAEHRPQQPAAMVPTTAIEPARSDRALIEAA
jgi:hypothetical protein